MKISIMRLFFFFLGLFGSLYLRAQDVTGIWRGHFRSNGMYDRLAADDDRYKFEVQIAQHDKNIEAVTYSYKTTVFYGKAEAGGTMNAKTDKVLLREMKITEVRMIGGDACIMTCFLQYSRIGDDEFLEGTYTSMNTRDSSNCGKGSVFLHKVAASDFYKEPFVEKREKEIAIEKNHNGDRHSLPAPAAKKNATNIPGAKTSNTLKKPENAGKKPPGNAITKANASKPAAKKKTQPPALAKVNTERHLVQPLRHDSSVKTDNRLAPSVPLPQALANRKNELVKTIVVNTGDIELNIYDDGAIDHDTVSVYLDKKLVISHAMLTDKAIILKLHLDDINDYHEVVMVAENEGEIPPNTSLMVVKAGDKQYEVRIVSTEQKNATVVFKFEKTK